MEDVLKNMKEEDRKKLDEAMTDLGFSDETGDMSSPPWIGEKGKLIETAFCECFLKNHPMKCINSRLYDTEGEVTDEALKKEIYDTLSPYYCTNMVRRILQLAQLMKVVADSEEPPRLLDRLNMKNGTLFLDGRFSSEKEICMNRFPVDYDPSAAKPEVWLRFISELLYPEDVPAFQEFMGYTFIPTNRAQVMMMLIGKGGEGKSQIGHVLRALQGTNMTISSIQKLVTNRFAKADQIGKLLMMDDDMNLDALPDTGTLKSLVTLEDKTDVEWKFGQSQQVSLTFRIMGFGNGSLSALYDRSDGFYRRQMIIQVREKPEDRVDDRFLTDKLVAEKEGIFLWCLQGLKRLIRKGYKFSVSDRMKHNLENVKREANNIIEFLESTGYIRLEEGTHAASKQLYNAYLKWCSDNAEKPLSDRTFTRWLSGEQERLHIKYAKNIDIGGNKRVRGYYGINVLVNTDGWS